MDIEHYFSRIGWQAGRQPTLEHLHALTRAHTQSIPFENLDVLSGVPVSLELDDIFRKLVLRRRGGYCFEHNGLFMWVLKQLGYRVSTLGARVRLRTPAGDLETRDLAETEITQTLKDVFYLDYANYNGS